MNIIFEPRIDPTPTPNNRSQSHSLRTLFSEACPQLLLESGNIPALDKGVRTDGNGNRRRQVFAGSTGLVEEAFYWFLTAPALVYVVYLAFGL